MVDTLDTNTKHKIHTNTKIQISQAEGTFWWLNHIQIFMMSKLQEIHKFFCKINLFIQFDLKKFNALHAWITVAFEFTKQMEDPTDVKHN